MAAVGVGGGRCLGSSASVPGEPGALGCVLEGFEEEVGLVGLSDGQGAAGGGAKAFRSVVRTEEEEGVIWKGLPACQTRARHVTRHPAQLSPPPTLPARTPHPTPAGLQSRKERGALAGACVSSLGNRMRGLVTLAHATDRAHGAEHHAVTCLGSHG